MAFSVKSKPPVWGCGRFFLLTLPLEVEVGRVWLQTCLRPRSRSRPSHSSPPSPGWTAARGFASRTRLLGVRSRTEGRSGRLPPCHPRGRTVSPQVTFQLAGARSSKPQAPRVGAPGVLRSALGGCPRRLHPLLLPKGGFATGVRSL